MGLDRNASFSEINKAYKSLVKVYHPDVSSHPRSKDNFQKIHEAYQVLSDKKKRADYDAIIDHQPNSENFLIQAKKAQKKNEHSFYAQNETLIKNGSEITGTFLHTIANDNEFVEINGQRTKLSKRDIPFNLMDIVFERYVEKEEVTVDGTDYVINLAHHVFTPNQEYLRFKGKYIPYSKKKMGLNTHKLHDKTKENENLLIVLVFICSFLIGVYIFL